MNPLFMFQEAARDRRRSWNWDRLNHFTGPIALIGLENPEVRLIIERYADGEIVTKEEALCQMVLALARSSEHHRKELLSYIGGSLVSPLFCK